MAICGWCRQTNLTNNKGVDGDGLEPHNLPYRQKRCEGPSTSPYAHKITAKRTTDQRQIA
jgi:hypothetical protein